MKRISKDPIKRFAQAISKDNKLFKKQLKEVKEKYPLVMLAYRTQRIVIKELLQSKSILDTQTGQILVSLDTEIAVKPTEQQVELDTRLRELKSCLMRHVTYEDGLACFE